MGKILDEIRITNNKIYENMPEGRLRHGIDGVHSRDIRTSKPSLQELNGASEPVILAPVEIVLASLEPPTISNGNMIQMPVPTPKKRKGRPRLFLALVVDQTDDTFVVLIKFNVRNKLAKRLFGISTPAPPPVPSLSRLRPPQVRNALKDLVEIVDETPLVRTTRKRVSKPPLVILGTPLIRNNMSKKRSLSITEARKEYKKLLSERAATLAATERLLESLERNLPYYGVLPFPDCIINNTDPTAADRKTFVELAERAAQKQTALQGQMMAGTVAEDSPAATPIPQGASHYYLRSQIEKLQFREFLIDTWYSSPYPEEYARNKVLYICEFCLKYMGSPQSYLRHQLKSCNSFKNHPPGVEIYRDPEAKIAFWEVDGRKNIEYCQSLCLLAKLFLNSKTLYYDVEPFVFYILTEIDEQDSSTYHFVGYFSKEKLNNSDYNVSCILTLPIYQRKGYGSLMIDFSYLLSRREFKYGTPEKPLSDLGLVSYRNYWKIAVATTLRKIYNDFLSNGPNLAPLTLENISQLTGMKPSDVVFALEQLDALLANKETGSYAISINLELIDAVISKWELRNYTKLNPEYLLWKPLIYGPSGGINSAPALALVSQPGVPAPSVSNSILMITEFLKDDIGNPFSFEEEAYKSFETAFETTQSADVQLPFNANDFHVCRPDCEVVPQERYTYQPDDIKLATADEDDEVDVDDELSDLGYEEDIDGEILVDEHKIATLVDPISGDDEEEDVDVFEEDSGMEMVEEEDVDDEEVEAEAEKSIDEDEKDEDDDDDDDGDNEINNEVVRERIVPQQSRKTRSQRLEETIPAQNNVRRSTRSRR